MFKKLRGLLLGLGTVVLFLIGVGAAGMGAEETSPSLPSLLLNSDDLPRGAVLQSVTSGPLDVDRVKAMGVNPKVTSGVPPAWIRTWTFPGGSTALRVLVAEAFTPSWAVEGLRSTGAGMRRRGFVPFTTSLVVPGSIGFTGILTGSSHSSRSSSLFFARGSLLFGVSFDTPSRVSLLTNLEAVDSLAREQLKREKAVYGGEVSQSVDSSTAVGYALGGALGYVLLLEAFAFWRDPLRRRLRRRTGAGVGRPIDVTAEARRLRRTAMLLLVLQLTGAGLVVDALLPHSLGDRIKLGAIGIAISLALSVFRARRGAGRLTPFWSLSGHHRVQATALSSLAAAAGLFAFADLAQGATASGGDPNSRLYVVAAACSLAVAGIALRRAHRVSAVSAREAMQRDERPMVLYLRSFGDDRLRLRSATLGRGSLIERLSPNRFDSFEEIIARHLSKVGPVVAINPPGTKLAPLGAARENLPHDDWQLTVDQWMDRAALIVIGAPAATTTPGLAWEIQHVEAMRRLSKTLIVVPPVRDKELQVRWDGFAAAAAIWPPAANLPAVPARVLAMNRKGDSWAIITADRRTEWSYAAALDSATEREEKPVDPSFAAQPQLASA
jgi:hypothetical protein